MAYKFQLGKAKLSGSVELTQQLKVASGGLSITGSVDLPVDAIENAELVNSTISGKELGTSLDTLSAAVNGGLSTFSYDGSGAVTVAVTSSIAGAGLAWSAGVLSVDTAEIAAGLSGSVEAMIGAFVEGSDFVTFDDGTGTIGVDASKFSGSFSAALATKSTTNLAEGSNLYYTDTRAKNAVGADGIGIEYNAGTGVFSLELSGTALQKDGSGLRTNIVVNTLSPFQNGEVLFNNADGKLDFKPVEEAWVRGRLSGKDAVNYNSASGSISLVLSGTSLIQSAGGLKTDIKAKIGGYDNSGSLAYNNANGELTFSPVAPTWVKGHFSAVDTAEVDMSYNASSGSFSAVLKDGSVANTRLTNSSVTVVAGGALSGGGTVALGDAITLNVEVNADALEVTGDAIALRSTIAGARTFSGNVIMSGDLTVNGTTTYLNTTELLVKDALIEIASGSVFAAGQGIRLGTENSLQTVSGFADVGDALSSSLPLVAPSMKAASFYGNLVGSMQLSIEPKSEDATIAKNITKAMANITLTLPSAPVAGQEHRVKCFVDDGSSPAVIVKAQTGKTIEGVSQVVLESYGAAVSLVWDGTMWMVF